MENALPGVEVLALEITGKERFCVFVDHPEGVDHALCARVTEVLRSYLDQYSVEISSPGLDKAAPHAGHTSATHLGRTVRIKTHVDPGSGVGRSAGERVVQIYERL